MAGELQQRDYAKTLARGLGCLEFLADRDEPASVSEVAEALDVHRASARRLLLTLQELGYVHAAKGRYTSAPKLLSLGRGLLGSQSVWTAAVPDVLSLADAVNEPASIAVLIDADVMIMCRDSRRRIYTSRLSVGTRLPAHRSAMGKMLLSDLAPDALDERIAAIVERHGDVDDAALRQELDAARANGFAESIYGLEEGLMSIAVPLRERGGRMVASHMIRRSEPELVAETLPALQDAAARVERIIRDFQERDWTIL